MARGLDIRDIAKMTNIRRRTSLISAHAHGVQPPPIRRLAQIEEDAIPPETRIAREKERQYRASQFRIKFVPKSPAEKLAALPKHDRDKILHDLGPVAAEALLYDWTFWARPEQLEPEAFASGDKFGWMIMAGRGSGKTRTGAQSCKGRVERQPKRHTNHIHIALIAETAADARDVMVEGESGILAISDPKFMPIYFPSRRLVRWPCGCRAHTYSGEEPDQLRGPQHDFAWVDELAKYKYPEETMDNLELGLRLGDTPQLLITTTPRPIKIVRELMKDSQFIVTSDSSYSNIQNLAPSFIKRVIEKYEGTRRGEQEIHARLLDEVEGSLWTRSRIEENRVRVSPPLTRIVVALDPSVTDDEDSDEIGIVVCGMAPKKGRDGTVVNHGYLLDDLSGIYSVDEWAKKAIKAFDTFEADIIVGEVNNGGDLIEKVLRTVRSTVPYRKVWASRGKTVRAEPISALDEQGKIHHVGAFAELEEQLVQFTPDGYIGGGSPDRADAYVWAFTELLLERQGDFNSKNWKRKTG